jgi:hypothetical protein
MNSSFTIRLLAIDSTTEENQTRAASSSIERPTANAEIADEVLMARVVDGDKEALAGLFRRYARLVRAVGYKILRDDSEADDLLQDVFCSFTRKARCLTVPGVLLVPGSCRWPTSVPLTAAAIWFPAISIPRSIWRMLDTN